MRFSQPMDFIAAIRRAPYQNKRNWICSLVKGKEVLDLGVVAHTLDFCLNHRESWLHGHIRDHASFVLGVDVLEEEVKELQKMGYNVIEADALTLRLGRKFDVVVCGDLIEHVSNPGALFDTIAHHLGDDGVGVVTTPNPFAISRFFNVLADGWTDINTEHVSWFCPQTMFQLAERSRLFVDGFCWLETDFPMPTRRRFFGGLLNFLAPRIASKRQLLRNDYGVLLRNKPKVSEGPDFRQPFVSVVLPTFNRRNDLEGAFDSLLAQDYPGKLFEIIVVDNGSSDDTPHRIRQLAQETRGKVNVKYVREDRRGLVFARHTGAAHAKGEILFFTDDDARFDGNWISATVDVYRNHPEVGAVGTKIAVQWDRDPEAWVRSYEEVLGKLDYGDRLIVRKGLEINGASFSIRKPLLLKLRGFNPGQKGNYIIGDSETGLCRKLAKEEVLVGWTPATTVWHLQRRETNGTLTDLRRRFRNAGISDAYYASFYGWTLRELLSDICRKSRDLLLKLGGTFRRREYEISRRDVVLGMEYYRYYITYLWVYRFNKMIRGEINKGDWLFDSDYEAPPAVLTMEYGRVGFSATDDAPHVDQLV